MKVTEYVTSFRGESARVFRQTFVCSEFPGQLVYTGKLLYVKAGKPLHIKATIKRVELGGKFLRISRPILLDEKPVPLLENID